MSTPGRRSERLEQALDNLRRALEGVESALLEFEEELYGESSVRPQERRGLDLLSIPEACQELGMGKSWVYRKLRSGEIPSIKLGRVIKIKRSALEEYLEKQAVQQAQDLVSQLADQTQGAVGQVAGQAGDVVHEARPSTGQAAQEEPKATQAAKQKAQELDMDLTQVEGSGAGGLITLKDVVSVASRR